VFENPLSSPEMPPNIWVKKLIAAKQEGKRTELGRQKLICPGRLDCSTRMTRGSHLKPEQTRPEDMSDDMVSGRASKQSFQQLAWHAASTGRGRGSSRSIGIRGEYFGAAEGDQSPQGDRAD
jgi:hypothetical protein